MRARAPQRRGRRVRRRRSDGAGAAISAANGAEVLSKAAEVGEDPGQLAEELRDLLQVGPIGDADCIEIASSGR
jgi:hypothetical protein